MPVSPKIGAVVQGRRGRYEILKILNQGNMAWSLEAADVSDGRRKTFLKYYLSPTPNVDWYADYIDHVNEINERLESSNAAQYCVLCQDLFTASPRPGKCPDEYLFQAFEFIDSGCDLRGLLDRGDLTWDKRKSIAKVFLASMKNIHAAGVVHCDLKPENVQMVPHEGTKLGLIPRMIDMDRSILATKVAPWRMGENPEGYTGTPGYLSPEHLTGKKPTTASDCFTIGLILSELLCCIAPFGRFSAKSQEAYKRAVLDGDQFDRLKLLGTLGNSAENAEQFAALVETCFSPNPGQRPTCADLHKSLLELDRGATTTIEAPLRPSETATASSEASAPPPPLPPAPPPVPFGASVVLPPTKQALVLTGDVGAATFRMPQGVGSHVLAGIVSNVRVFAKEQFRIEREGSDWYVAPCPNAPNLTAVNDQEVVERVILKDGDTISAMGRVSRKTASPLRVSFV